MNADSADTHLDLGDLIAEATGQAVDDQARDHLAHCEHCRAEANRWGLVAGGVRRLAAAAPDVPPLTRPGGPRHTRLRVLAGPRRRAVLAAGVAAALVLLAAVGYGASSFVRITFGTAGTGAETVLTAARTALGRILSEKGQNR